MRVVDINLYKILLDKRSYENILTYGISYKIFMGAKPLSIRFDQIDRFVKIYKGIRCLVLFCPEKYDEVYDRIKYIISEKSSITHIFNHNFAKIKSRFIRFFTSRKSNDFSWCYNTY